MATVREYYDTDFTRVLNVGNTLRVQKGGAVAEVPARLHLDFDANAKYVSCFLSSDASSETICQALLEGLGAILAFGNGVQVQSGFVGEQLVSSNELQFAGRFFIYHDHEIDAEAKQRIIDAAGSLGVFTRFRGPTFAAARTKLEKPLAFISHDSRDKEQIARPLAIGLSKVMVPVWYDEFSLKVGARLRESIERGLREAKKCVLVITPRFLENSGWTKAEFNAVFTRELVERTDVVLPVWCDVTREQVYEYSPVLADRFAVQWNLGVDEVVRRLHRSIVE